MEEKKLFSIGEVAKLYHISVGNLRHYEKLGLLIPEYTNPDSGYRYYSVKQFECLNTIRYLRSLDMSLDSIHSFLSSRDPDTLRALLLEQQSIVTQKKLELDRISHKIASRLNNLDDARNTSFNEITRVQLPERRMVILKTSIVPENYLSLEHSIRKLDRTASNVFLGKVGLGLTKDALLKGQFRPYELVFLLLEEWDSFEGEVTLLPPEACIVIRFQGGHENARANYQKLMQHIKEKDLEITGFAKEITLIDYGLTNDESQFVTEIQIPVN